MEMSPTEIQCIPDEILSKIFSYLPSRYILTVIVDVCYRWRSIVESDVYFWKNLQIVVICDEFVKVSHLNPSPSSTNTFCGETFYEAEGEIVIGENDLPKVSNVRSLKLQGDCKTANIPAMFVIRVLDKISKICKNIQKFESWYCFGATSHQFLQFLNSRYHRLYEIIYGTTAVWKIPYKELTHFQNLTTLISHDYKFMRSDINVLADDCEKLDCLWILFSRYVTNDDVIYFFEKKKGILKEIGLGSSINDEALEKVKDCKNLNVLFICDTRFVTEKSLMKITNLPDLKYVSFHRAKFHTEALLSWCLTSSVPSQLKILDLTDYIVNSNNIFQRISQICPLTTRNDVNNAIKRYKGKTKPRIHWMYYNVL